jgi:hypothetical protein
METARQCRLWMKRSAMPASWIENSRLEILHNFQFLSNFLGNFSTIFPEYFSPGRPTASNF